MFAHELQQIRTAELIREADRRRLIREVRRARRQARREARRTGQDDAERRVNPLRELFDRAA
ncbi:hypothetical protein [Streptomyces sp. AK02-01A]|uniref:hypothetical protein n=1 Tax=Streptomyces sp. AK02-01A TaxID=3028648 RepID=UPI0029BB1E10|nr:hypothetical protein [Streptomyces sp. AK02-01A]MDX3851888.1 hypothetical protein [Streptomyces sp. AK02-01A]